MKQMIPFIVFYYENYKPALKQKFSARFPNMLPEALDLLEKMLIFDPNKRITGMHPCRILSFNAGL